MEREIWEAAEFITEWWGKVDNLQYKLFVIPREAIDDDPEEDGAHLIIGTDGGGVRRVDELLDKAYSRLTNANRMFVSQLLETDIPGEAKTILGMYY